MDLPRAFTIREASHRIHDPLTSEKLAPVPSRRNQRSTWGWGVFVLMELFGGGQRRPADGSAPGRRGAIGAADTTTPTQATRNKMIKPP